MSDRHDGADRRLKLFLRFFNSLQPWARSQARLRPGGYGRRRNGDKTRPATPYRANSARPKLDDPSGPALVGDCQDDVSGFLLRFDVPGRLDHVLYRIAPIDDRTVFSGL